jgi:hypothetical protein
VVVPQKTTFVAARSQSRSVICCWRSLAKLSVLTTNKTTDIDAAEYKFWIFGPFTRPTKAKIDKEVSGDPLNPLKPVLAQSDAFFKVGRLKMFNWILFAEAGKERDSRESRVAGRHGAGEGGIKSTTL